jgi:Uncharacterized protein conserved in bacteria (DUF2135)
MCRSLLAFVLCAAVVGCAKSKEKTAADVSKAAQKTAAKEAEVSERTVAKMEPLFATDPSANGVAHNVLTSPIPHRLWLKRGGENGNSGKKSKPVATWKPSEIVPNTSRLKVGDKEELPLKGMQVEVQIDGFRARVVLDCFFLNDRNRRLEGNFQVRLPVGASLDFFAFGETKYQAKNPKDAQLAGRAFLPAEASRKAETTPSQILALREQSWNKPKVARVVPREKAAHAYRETVRRRVDPALAEWAGAGVFNARVFPLAAGKLHRVVIGYDVNLLRAGDDLVFKLDLPGKVPEQVVDVIVSNIAGITHEIAPKNDKPFDGTTYLHYRYTNPDERRIAVRLKNAGTILLTGEDPETGPYFATRFQPQLPADAVAGSPRAVFLLDTSLSSNPQRFGIWLKLLRAVLDNNRDSLKEFAVLFFDVETRWWKPQFVPNTPANVAALLKHCETLSLEGATNLDRALRAAVKPAWLKDAKTNHDLFLLSDAAVTWGENDLHAITRPWRKLPASAPTLAASATGRPGRLFAYTTGLTGTDTRVLAHLARETGGAVFSVVGDAEVATASKAHRSRAWEITNVKVTGGKDLLLGGRPRFVYPGQRLLLVGRGNGAVTSKDVILGKPEKAAIHPRIPEDKEIFITCKRGEETKALRIKPDRHRDSTLVPRLYGQVAVEQLEEFKDATEEFAAAYSRHFRISGQTCSLLMLESEADYKRYNIKPEEDAYVVKHNTAGDAVRKAVATIDKQLGDPRAVLLAWLKKLESTPGAMFKLPTSLRLAIEKMPASAFEIPESSLPIKLRTWDGIPGNYQEQLASKRFSYDAVTAEADRRAKKYGIADALRALSSLVENNPGDTVLARDVGFSAMQWGLGGEAYHLFRRVAKARPYEPQTYAAMARCLTDLHAADAAMVWYEVALAGQWDGRFGEFRRIAGIEYLQFLTQIKSGELKTSVPDYAAARLKTLAGEFGLGENDILVTITWNTDGTDVDLHVTEPNGETCFYKHTRTRRGGAITRDVTQGYGPEMYTIRHAEKGTYRIQAKYFASDANRLSTRTKVYATVYRHFGTPRQRVTRQVVTLKSGKEMHDVGAVVFE